MDTRNSPVSITQGKGKSPGPKSMYQVNNSYIPVQRKDALMGK